MSTDRQRPYHHGDLRRSLILAGSKMIEEKGIAGLSLREVARAAGVSQQFGKDEIRLVALTGYGQAKDRKAVFEAGFDEHLVKPVNLEKLKRVLSTGKNREAGDFGNKPR